MLAARSYQMLSVLRIVAALCFMEHGCQKLLGFPSVPPGGMPALLSLSGVAGVLELIGGLLVLVGFQTRIAAFLLSGEMAVGYWMIHAPKSFFPAEAYHQDFLAQNPTYPYIAINDLPKVHELAKMFPDLYRDKPVLVNMATN